VEGAVAFPPYMTIPSNSSTFSISFRRKEISVKKHLFNTIVAREPLSASV
jgi:hypothetical protein